MRTRLAACLCAQKCRILTCSPNGDVRLPTIYDINTNSNKKTSRVFCSTKRGFRVHEEVDERFNEPLAASHARLHTRRRVCARLFTLLGRLSAAASARYVLTRRGERAAAASRKRVLINEAFIARARILARHLRLWRPDDERRQRERAEAARVGCSRRSAQPPSRMHTDGTFRSGRSAIIS